MADNGIMISRKLLALIGSVVVAVATIGGLVWKASATLTTIQNQQAEEARELQQIQKDMDAVKSVLYVPAIQPPGGSRK